MKKNAINKKAACSWNWFLSLNLSSSTFKVRPRSGEEQGGPGWAEGGHEGDQEGGEGDNVCLSSLSHSLFDIQVFGSM